MVLMLWLVTQSIRDHVKIFLKSSPSKLQAYYSSLKAKLTTYLFIISWILFLTFYSYRESYIWLTVILIGVLLTMAVMTLKIYMTIASPWLFNIDTEVDNAANEALEKAVDEEVKEFLKNHVGGAIDEALEELIKKKANQGNPADAKSRADD